MRSFLIFIVLLTNFSSFAQTKFKLFGYYPCSKEIKEIKFFGLEKENESFTPIDTSGVVLLKDTGVYVLSYVVEMIDDSDLGRKYHVKLSGDLTDTLRVLKVTFCIEPTSRVAFSGYCCCDKKCEGQQTDYYKNGRKRIEGNFVGGKPIGKLIFYNLKGGIQEVDKYNKKGRLRKRWVPDKK